MSALGNGEYGRLFHSLSCLLLLIFAVYKYWSTGGAPEILSLFFFFLFPFSSLHFTPNYVFSCPRNFQSSLGSIADIVPRRFSGVRQS